MNTSKSLATKTCEKCNSNLGTVECATCYSNRKIVYCYDCDSSVHKHNTSPLHARSLIDYKTKRKEPSPLSKDYQLYNDPILSLDTNKMSNKNDNILTKEDLSCSHHGSPTSEKTKKIIEEIELKFEMMNDNSNDALKSFQAQIENVRKDYSNTADKLKEDWSRNSNELLSSFKLQLLQKDTIISELQSSYQQLNKRCKEEEAKNADLSQEISRLKDVYEQEIDECKQKFKSFQVQSEEIKLQHTKQNKDCLVKYEKDKEQLKEEYNRLLTQIKEDHEQKRNRIDDAMQEKDKQIRDLNREINDSKSISSMKADSLQKELLITQENLKSAKKLHELQANESQTLHNKLMQATKEIRILQEEIGLHEREKLRVHEENNSLKEKLGKCDRILYGKGKSPMLIGK